MKRETIKELVKESINKQGNSCFLQYFEKDNIANYVADMIDVIRVSPKLMVMDLQTSTIHEFKGYNLKEDEVLMYSKEYGHTSNKLELIRFIYV